MYMACILIYAYIHITAYRVGWSARRLPQQYLGTRRFQVPQQTKIVYTFTISLSI